MSISLKTKPQLMQKIEKAFNDTLYKDAIETSSNYNNRLIAERASRLPFIDLQTGVAQNNCTLWMNRWERMPGHNQGQIYSYPSRRWRKIRRSYLLNDVFSNKINLECNVSDKNELIGASSGNSNDNCAIDYPTELENVDSCEKFDPSKDNSGEPEESLPDISELVDIDDADTEDDDDSTSGTKKKARKKYAKRKKASEYTDAEKPYICDLCGIKYKTRPGLSYHYAHSHANSNGETSSGSSNGYVNQNNNSSSATIGMDDMGEMNTRSLVITPNHSRPGISNPQSLPSYQGHIGNSIKRESHFREKINPTASSLIDQRSLPINYQLNQQPNFVLSPKYSTTGKSTTTINHDSDEDDEKCKNKEMLTANTYCDFCLGNANENRNTGLPEKMISCSDCGRSAHLSCLKFTPNMIKSVGEYPWQCIECKSCSLCGSSDNDEQLLFCDDCDRGYHMFCLNPPLSEPPEGSWNCNLCKEAYHSQK